MRKLAIPLSMSRAAGLTVLAATCLMLAACGGGNQDEPGVLVSTIEALPPSAPVSNSATLPGRPTSGRWIDVDVSRFEVQLMDGETEIKTIGPVAVGEKIDTGEFESTQTGLFQVYVKTAGLQYDPPYDTYISDWVGFDQDKANGFHSFLKDAAGNVVDPGTGRISNGCIRSGDAKTIFDFAEIGMPVFVHT